MTFLPIVERELRVAARRRATYWTRLGSALIALFVGGPIMLLPSFRTPQLLGIALFVGLSIVSFTYCLLAGIRSTSDCLSEEKREGTLGLLFLTDLRGYDIILGKLVATSVNVFYGLLAIFPVMAIPLLLGGVTINEFWRVVLSSLNTLFFSLTVGMFASAISKDERKAMLGCFLIVLFFTAALPLIGASIGELTKRRQWLAIFLTPSPVYPCWMAFEQNFARAASNRFYQSTFLIHGLGWLFLLASCLIVPRSWTDKAESAGKGRRRAFWSRLALGTPSQRLALRRAWLQINPVFWLAGRDRLKFIWVWMVLAAGGLFWVWGLIKYPRDWRDEVSYVATALFAHTILKVWLATEACRRFGLDRRSGALELVLATSLSVKEILRGQLLALRRQFLGPALVVLLADFVFLSLRRRDDEWVWMWVCGMSMFAIDLLALAWVGMWTGLQSRSANRASAAAISRILVLPWVIYLMMLTGLAVFARRGMPFRGGWELFPFVSWLMIGLAIDAIFGFVARAKLFAEFRILGARRFEERRAGAGD